MSCHPSLCLPRIACAQKHSPQDCLLEKGVRAPSRRCRSRPADHDGLQLDFKCVVTTCAFTSLQIPHESLTMYAFLAARRHGQKISLGSGSSTRSEYRGLSLARRAQSRRACRADRSGNLYRLALRNRYHTPFIGHTCESGQGLALHGVGPVG